MILYRRKLFLAPVFAVVLALLLAGMAYSFPPAQQQSQSVLPTQQPTQIAPPSPSSEPTQEPTWLPTFPVPSTETTPSSSFTPIPTAAPSATPTTPLETEPALEEIQVYDKTMLVFFAAVAVVIAVVAVHVLFSEKEQQPRIMNKGS